MADGCGNCKFARERGGYLFCHRRSPQVLPNPVTGISAHFPLVDKDTWCGEYEVKPDSDKLGLVGGKFDVSVGPGKPN